MKGIIIFQILFSIILLMVLFYILRMIRSNKYNERLSKYTINNNRLEKKSLGDKLVSIYNKFQNIIVKSLKKTIYFKRKAQKYERFSYINSGINIIATKFSLAVLFGLIYIVSSVYRASFDIFILLLIMIIGYLSYNVYLLINEKIRNKYIEADLLKAIIIMNNAFKSGYNITQAINIVSKDLTGPISDEFAKIGNDLKYGLELKDVFDRFYDRVRIDDAKYITSSLSLLNLTGGNLVGIFTSIEKSFTNRKRIHDELNAMTSSSKLVFYILLVMPIIIISLLLLFSPNYFSPLFTHPVGILICFLSVFLYVLYIIIIRKILKVET